jgi:predicted transcriptional regulator
LGSWQRVIILRHNKKQLSPRDGTAIGVFGPLEQVVVKMVRDRGSATVGDVHKYLERSRTIAYTTVMTIMSRLADKGILDRRKEGRRFIYEPAPETRPEASARFRQLFNGLIAGFRGAAIRHFVESVSALDDQALLELENEVLLAKSRRKKGKK